MKRLTLTFALAAFALVLAACSSASGADAPSAPTASDADVVIVAKDMRFEQAEYTAPVGRPFSLEFVNREGAPHNVAIYTDSSAKTLVYQGEIFSGDGARTYRVPALTAGSYFFRCDVHPNMTGTLVAR